jgi:hypothetical protein
MGAFGLGMAPAMIATGRASACIVPALVARLDPPLLAPSSSSRFGDVASATVATRAAGVLLPSLTVRTLSWRASSRTSARDQKTVEHAPASISRARDVRTSEMSASEMASPARYAGSFRARVEHAKRTPEASSDQHEARVQSRPACFFTMRSTRARACGATPLVHAHPLIHARAQPSIRRTNAVLRGNA